VIHIDIPYSPEAYLQETGRAGRDGRPVEATLLHSAEGLDFAEVLSSSAARIAGVAESPENTNTPLLAVERYAQMLGYALDTEHCRREQLLRFLGREAESCSGCDVCDGRVLVQAEEESQILDFVSRNRRRFTLLRAVQILQGTKSYEVVCKDPNSFYGFGLLFPWREEAIEDALSALRCTQKLRVLKRGFWKDRITV
jgi:ATP-dependent DNA helicase RecQ